MVPLLDRTLPPAVSFRRVDVDPGSGVLQKLREYAPQSLVDRETFIKFMIAFYDEYVVIPKKP